MKKARLSFTILELVIVMTITGIIVGSTFQMFMNIYISYSNIYLMNSLDMKLLNSSMKVVKYIENRVRGSLIDSNQTDFNPLSGNYLLDRNQSLQWVGIASDTYLGSWKSSENQIISNWSGFVDLNLNHNNKTIYLDKTDFSQAEEIIYNLSKGEVNISNPNSSNPAIFFKGGMGNSKNGFGWKESINGDLNSSEYAFIGYFSDNKFLSSNQVIGFENSVKELKIYEQYYLSWSAYGLKVETDNNLSLYWNYRPWNGENMEKDGEKITLLQDVTTFKYGSNGSSITLEICIKSIDEIVFCRESLIY